MRYAADLDRRGELSGLLERVRDRLSPEDRGYIADFIEVNEYVLALEWVVDAFGDRKRAFSPEEIEAICAIAKKLGIYSAILDRLHSQPP